MEQLNQNAEQVSERSTPWSKWRIILLGIFAVTFLTTLLLFIYKPPVPISRRAGEGAGASAVIVELTPVRMQDVSIDVVEKVTVVPTSDVPVLSEKVGWVQAVNVKKGQSIRTGQAIATLQPADSETPAMTDAYQAALQNLLISQTELDGAENALMTSQSAAAATRARLAETQTELVAARSAEKIAQRQYVAAVQSLQNQSTQLEQSERLLAQGVISRSEMDNVRRSQSQASSEQDQARLALEGAREQSQMIASLVADERTALVQSQTRVAQSQAQLRAARSRMQNQQSAVRQTETRLKSIRQNQKSVQLKSPADGVVSEVPVKSGALLTPAVLIARIKRPDLAVVSFTATESEAARLKKGMSAMVELPAEGKTFNGKISALTYVPGAQRQNVRVVVDVPKAAQTLKPGNRVITRISYDKIRAAIIPGSAIVLSVKGAAVWTVKDGFAHVQQVKLAQPSGRTAIVTGGLKDGDYIITSAVGILREGSPVAVKG